jgi:immune inhibitor A
MGDEVTGNVDNIWSAKWVLPNAVTVNGVKVFGFLTIPEGAFIDVCPHELGHLLLAGLTSMIPTIFPKE